MNRVSQILFGLLVLSIVYQENQATNAHLRSLRKWLPGLEEWNPSEELRLDVTAYQSGYDYNNRSVIVVNFGMWNVSKYLNRRKLEEQLLPKLRAEQMVYRVLDNAMSNNETETDSGFVFIADAAGLTYAVVREPKSLQFYIWLIHLFESVIEFAGDVFLINVTKPVEVILGAVKPITPKFFSVANVMGTNQNKIIAALHEIVPKDQLPLEYGGNEGFKPLKVL